MTNRRMSVLYAFVAALMALLALGMYGRFDAQMVGFDNVPEMESALRTGKVDALIDFLRTSRREQEFIFTQGAILEEQVSVYTRNADGVPSAESPSALGDLRIGYVSDAGYLDDFVDYCSAATPTPASRAAPCRWATACSSRFPL